MQWIKRLIEMLSFVSVEQCVTKRVWVRCRKLSKGSNTFRTVVMTIVSLASHVRIIGSE